MTYSCGHMGSVRQRAGGEGMKEVWQKTADRMRDALGQVSYETWIGPLSFVALNNGTATIEAPNRFFRDWVSDRYLDLLRHSLSTEVGEPTDIKLTFGKDVGAPINGHANANGHANGQANGNGNSVVSKGKTLAKGRVAAGSTETPPRELHPGLAARYPLPEFVVRSRNQF